MATQLIPQPSIRLDIRHPEIYLDGDFTSWQSAVLMGPDMDELTIRLMVDATSAWFSGHGQPPRLFTFHGRDVEQLTPTSYRVAGELEADGHTRPLDIVVETPPFHSPQFGITLTLDKTDLGVAWRSLLAAASIPDATPATTEVVNESGGMVV